MGIPDRLLGKKNVNGHPHIEDVHPSFNDLRASSPLWNIQGRRSTCK
jgi:hypothetical protein